MGDIENPMVIDSLWDNLDGIDREQARLEREEIEAIKADELFEERRVQQWTDGWNG